MDVVNRSPGMGSISFLTGPLAGSVFQISKPEITIGREPTNDIVISDPSVSRRHARLWFDNGRWYLEDLQSANGTLVNNVRVYQPVALNDGDVINFGDEIVVFNTTY